MYRKPSTGYTHVNKKFSEPFEILNLTKMRAALEYAGHISQADCGDENDSILSFCPRVFLWSPEVVLFTAVARSGELLAIMKPGMLSKMGKYKGRCQIGCLARNFKSQAVILLLAMYLISSGPILAFF